MSGFHGHPDWRIEVPVFPSPFAVFIHIHNEGDIA